MIRVAIVEDEEKERNTLLAYLDAFKEETKIETTVSIFENGLDIVDDYQTEYDVIFLDIEMPQMNGMEAARKIRNKDNYVVLVFVTNLLQYAIEGYGVNASNFILKPISYFTFKEEMHRVIKKLSLQNESFLTINIEGGLIHLPLKSITYVETVNRKLAIHTVDKVYYCRETMKAIEEKVGNSLFFRCHNVYLVNLSYVEAIENSSCVVNGDQILISRYKKKEFIDALTNLKGVML